MRERIGTEHPRPVRPDVIADEAGGRLIANLEALGRKPTTLATHRSLLRTHLVPNLEGMPLDRVGVEAVEDAGAAMRRAGAGPKTTRSGHWGTPKSKRGSRSVPPGDRVAAELERHFQGSSYQGEDDLVFPTPHAGDVLDHSSLVRRYKRALRKAGLRDPGRPRLRCANAACTSALKEAAFGRTSPPDDPPSRTRLPRCLPPVVVRPGRRRRGVRGR